MIGRTLGHYRIVEKIGAGGMGEVYRAQDERLGRDIALKLLPVSALTDAAARARLLNEARTASALNHPHICTIYEVGEADGQSYIAMEFVEGRAVSALLTADGLPVETIIRYATQIADALAHAHERGVIHRDLKSSNVVITPEGRAKVLDFGLAKRTLPDELTMATQSYATLTETGGISGTLYYLAPEVLRGEPADARSDLWALGVVLYEMATGQLPFKGETGFELTSAVLRDPPPPLPARLPAGLRGVIQRCLVKEPAQRYQRASEVRAALEAIGSGLAVAAPAPAARPSRKMLYKVRSSLRGKGKLFALIVAGGFAGGVAGFFLGGPPRRPTWRSWMVLISALVLVIAAYAGLIIFWLKKWSFVVYPDKIRVQGRRRSIDIPFDQIESVELVSYRISYGWGFLARQWKDLTIALHPRYPKLGEAQATKLTGMRQVLKVNCTGLGWRRGYYLDVEQPERFLETLTRALERYRAERGISRQ